MFDEISVIYLEYGSGLRRRNLSALATIARRLPAQRRRLLVVDNAGTPRRLVCPAPFDELVLLTGQNRAREFSGWDCGIEWLREQPIRTSCDRLYVFANDTLAAHRPRSSVRLARFAGSFRRMAVTSAPVMCGEVNHIDAEIPSGARCTDYVSTYLFGLNGAAFDMLTPFLSIEREIEAMLRRKFEPGRGLLSDDVAPEYADFITRWLTRAGNWHGARPLSAETFAFLRLKAKSILLEHALSSRLQAAGGEVRSIYGGVDGLDRFLGRLASRHDRLVRRLAAAASRLRDSTRSVPQSFEKGG